MMKKHLLLLAVGFILPAHAMDDNKLAGALKAAGGAGAIGAGSTMAIGLLAGGSGPAAPLVLIGGALAANGVAPLVDGIKEIFGKGNGDFKDDEILIRFKDQRTGEKMHHRFSGSDVDKFLKNDGFIISWRGNYPVQRKDEESQDAIHNELKKLQRSYGRPYLYGNFVEINNPELRAEHAAKIENPLGVDALAQELAQNKQLFIALRKKAVYSWGTPSHKDNLPLFTNAVSKVMATLILVKYASWSYPYEELVRTLRVERNNITHDYNEMLNARNAVRIEKAQIENALTQAQQRARRIQEDATAQKFQLYQEAAQAEEQHNLTLAQAAQQTIDIESQRAGLEEALLVAGSREQRLNETLAQSIAQSCAIEEQRFELEEENEGLRQQLQALQQQLADSQKIIRKQSKNNRKTVNKLQVLQRAQQK